MTREDFAKSSREVRVDIAPTPSVSGSAHTSTRVGLGRDGLGKNPLPPSRGMGTFRRMPEELRALASEAYVLWRDLAKARSNPYGDHSGCLLAGRMAIDATTWEDGLTVLASIRARMDEKSSPRWIPEWSRDLGAQKRESLRIEQKAAEAAQVDDMDPEARRVMISIGRAKAAGRGVSLEDVTCIICRQFTETKCPTCRHPLHARACPPRHECAPSALVSSPHYATGQGSPRPSAVHPDETRAVGADSPSPTDPTPTGSGAAFPPAGASEDVAP